MEIPIVFDHARWMREAFCQAEKAFESNEIPVGAVIVRDGQIIGRGYNQREQLLDPTAHAEMIAITAAANTLGDWRLNECTLYVTKEPCSMCSGAIVNARIGMVIFGCYDDKKGCCGSLYNMCTDSRLGKPIPVKGGIMEDQCLSILQEFFQKKRRIN